MDNKLPKVYENKISKKVANNSFVYYGGKTEKEEKRDYIESIDTKINKLFKSPKYIYKIDVELSTKSGKKYCKIIGKNSRNIITIDNELIPIDSIIDIKEI